MEEKKELSKKEKRTLMIVSLAIVIALVFGISYAYFMAVGQSSEQTITTANLSLTFDDGTAIVNATDISPLVREVALPTQDSTGVVTTAGEAVTKTFTITNTGNQKLFVDISLDDMTLPDDLKRYDFLWSLYEVTDEANNIEKNIGIGSFEYAEDGVKVGQYLVFDAPGDGVTTHERTFRLYIWIEELTLDQQVMMGETFKATIKATGQKYYTSPESDFSIYSDEFYGNTFSYSGNDTNLVIPETINGLDSEFTGNDTFDPDFSSSGIKLESVVLPTTLIRLGINAFYNNNLTSIVIPNSVTITGTGIFANNKLTNVIIPNSITSIDDDVFNNNQLKSAVIPNSITYIGSNAFRNNQLTNIIIPNGVTEIRQYAFGNNQLASVVIPDSVTFIGESAFADNPNLTQIIVLGKSEAPTYDSDTNTGFQDGWNSNAEVIYKP